MNQANNLEDDEIGGTPIPKIRRTPPQQQQQMSPQQQPVINNGINLEQPPVFMNNNFDPEQEKLIRGMKMNNNNKKKMFNKDSEFNVNLHMKYSIIVAILFILLNSKMIWTQISKLPMMGSIEPSILALVFNSLLSGILFYCIIKFVK
jgi:uncharacterized membrane protein YagU involved in acid resistance